MRKLHTVKRKFQLVKFSITRGITILVCFVFFVRFKIKLFVIFFLKYKKGFVVNVFLSPTVTSALNAIKTALPTLSDRQKKVMSVVALVFAALSSIGVVYRCCFKAKQRPPENSDPLAPVLQKYGYEFNRLPVLDVTSFKNPSEIQAEHVTAPVMRFEKESEGGVIKGVVFHIKGKPTSTRKVTLGEHTFKASNINGVWTLWQKAPNSDSWRGRGDVLISILLNARQYEEVRANKIKKEAIDWHTRGDGLLARSFIEGLLTRKDKDFELSEGDFNLLN